jgi:uncharacterized protein
MSDADPARPVSEFNGPKNSATQGRKSVPERNRRGCGYGLRLVMFGAVAFVLIFFPAWEYAYVDAMVRPVPSRICCKTPADDGVAYQVVSFRAPDGFSLSGWYIPSRNGAAVILLHGYGANRLEMLDRAVDLAKAGFGVLLYDLRGHGESGGQMRAMGWPDAGDVAAALDFLDRQSGVDRHRVGGMGFSIGGQILLRAAAEDSRLRALFVDDPSYTRIEDIPPMPTWTEDFEARGVTQLDLALISLKSGVAIPAGTVQAIQGISPRPIFFVSTSNSILSKTLEDYFFSVARDPKERLDFSDADHGGSYLLHRKEYGSRMVQFFEKWIGVASIH